jgi:hypothetical protein
LSTSAPRGIPTTSRSPFSSSIVSLTGIASGRATSTAALWRSSVSCACIRAASSASGPGGTVSTSAFGRRSSVSPWPVAGESRITRS